MPHTCNRGHKNACTCLRPEECTGGECEKCGEESYYIEMVYEVEEYRHGLPPKIELVAIFQAWRCFAPWLWWTPHAGDRSDAVRKKGGTRR